MVEKDRLLAALAAEERRFICRYLLSRQCTVVLEELTIVLIAGAKHCDEKSSIDEDRFDDTAAMLHHRHLPKLDEAELIEYDPETLLVEPGTALPRAELVLDALEEYDAPHTRV